MTCVTFLRSSENMAKSGAHRQKIYREKDADYRRRECERAKEDKAGYTEERLEHIRKQSSLRMKKLRLKKKANAASENLPLTQAYQTRNSGNRATNK